MKLSYRVFSEMSRKDQIKNELHRIYTNKSTT